MNDQLLDQPITADHIVKAAGPTPWEVLWQRKSYVALGAVVGLALGVLYWSMAPRVYESSAQIWVLKKQPDAPISPDSQSMAAANYNASEDFLSTHRTLIQSAVIAGKAVEKGRLDERAVFRTSRRPAHDLARALTVSRDRDKSAGSVGSNSQVLNISYRCGYPDDCAPVLSAVIDSYQKFLDDRSQDSSKQTLALIEKARDLLLNDLEAKEKARDKFLSTRPALWRTQQGTTLYQGRLMNLDAQRTSLNVQVARLRATLDEVDKALKQGRSQAELLDLVSALPGQAPLMAGGGLSQMGQMGMVGPESSKGGPTLLSGSLEQELIALQLEEGRLLQHFGPKHPHVKTLNDRIQTIRSLLAPSATAEATTAEQRDRDARAKEQLVTLRIAQLKQEFAQAERALQSLNILYDQEMREAKKVFPDETQEAAYIRAIKRSQDLYDTITTRLRNLDVSRNTQGYETQVITPPTDAEKVSPRGTTVLPIALFVGLLLGCGLAYLADFTDKSFRSAEDIRRRLGLPIMGIIPLVKQDSKGIVKAAEGEEQPAPSIFTWHRKASKEAEAYRGVRTALYFSTHGQGRKVIQVTSPNKGDGKSTLAANLAVSIAQSGKTALLVDGDLRRPQVHKLFGIDRPIGFASVLGGLTEPNEAIVPTIVPGLSVIPAGATPPNPAELLTGTRLHEVLAWVRERYDYVIVDSPPLLAVTDPGVVGSQVDGVVLALRPTKKSRVEAKRAKEILENLGVTVFGVVVNALDQAKHHEEYGYYGYYRYYDYHEADSTRNGEERHRHVEPIGGGRNRS